MTSTAAIAAERLAADLAQAGVNAPAYSTVALQNALRTEQIQLGPHVTVIHDEAAVASTREQHQLLAAVEASGARLVIIGDPKQSKPVGAGGLWPHLEQLAIEHNARVELAQNLRAQHPADRRDQKLFRDGQELHAIRGYANRQRVQVGADQPTAEDNALNAAHDRRKGMNTLVIAQASNNHLDELNARAQAIRISDGELGNDSLPIPGRPYDLHAGDEVQVRRTLNHPDRQLRNGTTATITQIEPDEQAATIRLADDSELRLNRRQLDQADIRLAYVQHPLPAQGATVDTAYLILTDQTTKEGAYVAISRSRKSSHIHAGWEALTADPEQEPLPRLAELLARTEPDIPSIATPLAHERQIEENIDRQQDAGLTAPIGTLGREQGQISDPPPAFIKDAAFVTDDSLVPQPNGSAGGADQAQLTSWQTMERAPGPRQSRGRDPGEPAIDRDTRTRDDDIGWEL